MLHITPICVYPVLVVSSPSTTSSLFLPFLPSLLPRPPSQFSLVSPSLPIDAPLFPSFLCSCAFAFLLFVLSFLLRSFLLFQFLQPLQFLLLVPVILVSINVKGEHVHGVDAPYRNQHRFSLSYAQGCRLTTAPEGFVAEGGLVGFLFHREPDVLFRPASPDDFVLVYPEGGHERFFFDVVNQFSPWKLC